MFLELCPPICFHLGFQGLSKAEIKRDTKDIEKAATYAVSECLQIEYANDSLRIIFLRP